MDAKRKPSGIEGLGDMSWGTHFCLFYETEQDLLETLAVYFKTGLANHEFCLWITPDSFKGKARNALRQFIPSTDQHLEEGNIEIISCQQWYCENDEFDGTRVIQAFDTKLAQALEKGYVRMRVLADEAWLDEKRWKVFSDYEGKIDERFAGKPVSIVCAYPTAACSAANILDVARTHHFITAKRNGNWEILEAPELKHIKAEFKSLGAELGTPEKKTKDSRQDFSQADLTQMNQALQAEIIDHKRSEEALRTNEYRLQAAIDAADIGLWDWDLVSGQMIWLGHHENLFGFAPGEFDDTYASFEKRVHPEDLEEFNRVIQHAREEHSEYAHEYRIVWPDGNIHWIAGRGRFAYNQVGQPVRMYGAVLDITERKQAEEHIRQYAARMEALAEISQALAEVGLDVQAVFETIVRHTAELIGDTCVIRLLSSDEQWLKSVTFHNPNPEVKALMRLFHPTTPTSANDSWLTPVLRTGQPLLIPVITQEQVRLSVQPEYLPFFEQVGLHSMLIVPLRVKGRVIGTLGLSRDNPGHPYTLDDQVLLQDLADRASLTIQNAQLFEQVEGAREQLGALSRRLLEVQESERRALTTELHDRVGQSLTGLSILLQNIKVLLSDETARKLVAKFDDAQALVEDTTRQIRDIMAELHLPELEDYGLAAALETYAERVASRGNLKLITDLPDLTPPPLPSDVRIALFRATQEAISNVLKHADATQLEISLQGENGRLRLRVEDDGQGFEPEAASQKDAPSWGLQIMRERIESIGGNVQIESEPGQGTRVTFEIERPS